MAKPSEDTLTTIFKEILSEKDINVDTEKESSRKQLFS